MFETHYDFIWRFVRRLGVTPASVEDAVQDVFVVATRKIGQIRVGAERSFLCSSAFRIASESRRAVERRSENLGDDALESAVDPSPRPDDLAEQKRARELLDQVLESMPLDLRAVFVLYTMEELTMIQIAEYLDLPQGTVASRLRRAREQFSQKVERLAERMEGGPGD